MHRKHIQIAFDQYALALAGNFVFGEIDAVEGFVLDVNLCLGRVYIFGYALVSLECAASEGDYLPCH